jgi:hypothetical protein
VSGLVWRGALTGRVPGSLGPGRTGRLVGISRAGGGTVRPGGRPPGLALRGGV